MIVSLVLIVLLSPVLLLGALVVKLTSRGPLLYGQTRTGRGDTPFCVYKFRSMTSGRKHDPKEIIPLEHPDITPAGRVLRRTKIDELPQLFSVLSGRMSLVGPRPTIPEQTEKYNAFQKRRLLVRPGITGLAQVNGSGLCTWDERIAYDVYYVRYHGLLMDMGILLKTIPVVLLGDARFTRPFSESKYARRQSGA